LAPATTPYGGKASMLASAGYQHEGTSAVPTQKTRRTSHLVYAHLSRRDIEKQLFLFEKQLREQWHETGRTEVGRATGPLDDALSTCDASGAADSMEEAIQEAVQAERERLVRDYEARQSEKVSQKEAELDKKKAQEHRFRQALGLEQEHWEEGKAFRFEELASEKAQRRDQKALHEKERLLKRDNFQ
jgi:hypothetical protein